MTQSLRVTRVPETEMTTSLRVPRVLKAELTQSSRVPRVLKAEINESSGIPRVLKTEMTSTRRCWYSDDICISRLSGVWRVGNKNVGNEEGLSLIHI